jgi:hypothetical protein
MSAWRLARDGPKSYLFSGTPDDINDHDLASLLSNPNVLRWRDSGSAGTFNLVGPYPTFAVVVNIWDEERRLHGLAVVRVPSHLGNVCMHLFNLGDRKFAEAVMDVVAGRPGRLDGSELFLTGEDYTIEFAQRVEALHDPRNGWGTGAPGLLMRAD